MGIGTGSAAIIGGIGAAGSIASGAIGSHAAGSAADAQAAAANHAADLNFQAEQNSLDFQKQMWATQQANLAPWLQAGTQGISTLADLLKTPGSGLLTPYSERWSAPTGLTEQNDPGYQARLALGQQAMERSAAARGGLLTGGTARAENQAAQDYASNEYANVYNRALTDYNTRFNVFNANQTNTYNRLAGLSGAGQQAASTLNATGSGLAQNVGNTYMFGAQNIGNALQNAAAARASGYVGGANAWSQGLSGLSSSLMNMYLMQNLFGGGGSTNPGSFGGQDPFA